MRRHAAAGAGFLGAGIVSIAGCAALIGVEDWSPGTASPDPASAGGAGGKGDGGAGTAGAAAASGGAGGAGGCMGCECCGAGTTCSLKACTCFAGLAAGWDASCAVSATGKAWCWGDNSQWQIGVGSTAATVPKPTLVPLDGVAKIAMGSGHACAATTAGEVWCWGVYSSGELGYMPENDADARVPTLPIPGLAGVSDVAAGIVSSCALLQSGTVRCWGSNALGRLGVNANGTHQSMTPVEVDGITNAIGITFGSTHACALLEGGTVACWGANNRAQLGDLSTDTCQTDSLTPCSSQPRQVNLPKTVEVRARGDHTCARTPAGAVWCWGHNDSNEVGAGNMSDPCPGAMSEHCMTPKLVDLGAPAVRLGLGRAQSCALLAAGETRCWGNSDNSIFGAAGTFEVPMPTAFPPAVDLALGEQHMCVRTSDDAISCAGRNQNGQLGIGALTPQRAPIDAMLDCR